MRDSDLPVLADDAEISRIAVYEARVFKESIRCPEITFNRKMPQRLTMSREQCMLRVYTQAECTEKCAIAKKLLAEIKKRI